MCTNRQVFLENRFVMNELLGLPGKLASGKQQQIIGNIFSMAAFG